VAPDYPGRHTLALGEGRASGKGRGHGQGTPVWGRDLLRLRLPVVGRGAPGVAATALPQVTDGQVLRPVVVVPVHRVARLGPGRRGAAGLRQQDERGHQRVGRRRGGALLAVPSPAGDRAADWTWSVWKRGIFLFLMIRVNSPQSTTQRLSYHYLEQCFSTFFEPRHIFYIKRNPTAHNQPNFWK